MNKFFVAISAFFLVVFSACTPTYNVDLKIKNNTAYVLTVEYMSKDNSKTIKKVLQPNEQFSISKYERNGTELEWATVWKYKIVRVYTNNNLNSWKDYNIEGAWDLENSRYKAKGSLILEATDFLADIQ